MGVSADTVANWESGKTEPIATQFRPVVEFLGYDPTPEPKSVAERLKAKRRILGATHSQIARYFGWDPGTLTRYLNGTWQMSDQRTAKLEAFLSADMAELSIVLSLPRRR